MLPPVFQLLKASSNVRAIVGTNPPRIWRHGAVPESVPTPIRDAYVVWLVILTPENQISGTPTADRATVQLDCFHPTDAGVVDLATAVRDALEPHGHMTSTPFDGKEPESKLFRMSLQFDIFVNRPT